MKNLFFSLLVILFLGPVANAEDPLGTISVYEWQQYGLYDRQMFLMGALDYAVITCIEPFSTRKAEQEIQGWIRQGKMKGTDRMWAIVQVLLESHGCNYLGKSTERR